MSHKKRNAQTDTHTDRQTDWQTDRQTDNAMTSAPWTGAKNMKYSAAHVYNMSFTIREYGSE